MEWSRPVNEFLVRQVEGQMASGDPSGLSCEEERIAVLFSYQATKWVERSEAFLSGARMMRKSRSLLVLSVGGAE